MELGIFTAKVLTRLIRGVWLVPLIFIALKIGGVGVFDFDTSNLVAVLTLAIPALEQQYELLKHSGRSSDAAAIAVYYLVLIVLFSGVSAAALWQFLTSTIEFKKPNWQEWFLVGCGVVCLFTIRNQTADGQFGSVYRLYFDNFGLYYLRQFGLYFMIQLSFALAMLMVVDFLRRPARKSL